MNHATISIKISVIFFLCLLDHSTLRNFCQLAFSQKFTYFAGFSRMLKEKTVNMPDVARLDDLPEFGPFSISNMFYHEYLKY